MPRTVNRDEATAKQIQMMAAFGVTIENIAKIVGMSKNTMRKLYAEEMELGKDKMVVNVANRLYQRAMSDGRDGVTAAIFLLKTQGKKHGFVDRQEVDAISETTGEIDDRINELVERIRARASNANGKVGANEAAGAKTSRASEKQPS